MSKLSDAFKAFWRTLTASAEKTLTKQEKSKSKTPESPTAESAKPVETGVSMFENGFVYALTLLQRNGRLVDFLKEDVAGFDDAQIGAAVRQIHADCRATLDKHVALKPVIDAVEGEATTVPDTFDPSTIRLTGNAPDAPPYNGALQHKGWIVEKLDLPERSGKVNPNVVFPAEVSF